MAKPENAKQAALKTLRETELQIKDASPAHIEYSGKPRLVIYNYAFKPEFQDRLDEFSKWIQKRDSSAGNTALGAAMSTGMAEWFAHAKRAELLVPMAIVVAISTGMSGYDALRYNADRKYAGRRIAASGGSAFQKIFKTKDAETSSISDIFAPTYAKNVLHLSNALSDYYKNKIKKIWVEHDADGNRLVVHFKRPKLKALLGRVVSIDLRGR